MVDVTIGPKPKRNRDFTVVPQSERPFNSREVVQFKPDIGATQRRRHIGRYVYCEGTRQ